ncbi:sulfur carrier protein ThiS (plastid) [Nitzschia inconspicua]|uniref:Sulfur carrier protein ThiS n=1 Tax=Nitzschia inconspicua TaxID=303405 RepID=A0A8H2SI41_9STRA|nr:sulfur carrier protein ThiS [Nitzschia inconspicua]
MTNFKHFLLNGETYRIDHDISLFDLLTYFNYNDSLLVLEHNHLICEKNKWKTTFIQHSDVIEIVTIVGGG